MRKPIVRPVPLSTLILLCAGYLPAAPWIQQNRWMVLGPIENPAGCYNDVQNPPLPDHSIEKECPRVGDDWKGEAFFVDGAPTTWMDLGGIGVSPDDVL